MDYAIMCGICRIWSFKTNSVVLWQPDTSSNCEVFEVKTTEKNNNSSKGVVSNENVEYVQVYAKITPLFID